MFFLDIAKRVGLFHYLFFFYFCILKYVILPVICDHGII